MENPERIQDTIGEFITEAMNFMAEASEKGSAGCIAGASLRQMVASYVINELPIEELNNLSILKRL